MGIKKLVSPFSWAFTWMEGAIKEGLMHKLYYASVIFERYTVKNMGLYRLVCLWGFLWNELSATNVLSLFTRRLMQVGLLAEVNGI